MVDVYKRQIKDCAACHTKENAVAGNQFVTPDNKACLTCHQSYAAVAEKTKNLKNGEPNPHASHHLSLIHIFRFSWIRFSSDRGLLLTNAASA